MKIWIANLAPGTTVEKVERLLEKYGLPRPDSVLPITDGAEPGMVIRFRVDDFEAEQNLRKLMWRIEGLYWEGHRLVVTPLHH